MALKDILVHLDSDNRSSARLSIAAGLARRHAAHLIGLFVVDVPRAEYFYGSAMTFMGPEQLIDRFRQESAEAARKVEAQFQDLIRREGIEGEWRQVEDATGAAVSLHARYADITVLGQPNYHEFGDVAARDAVVTTALMSSGRPVLTIPYAGNFPVVGDRVLVAWNASREATRAVNDAMPLLEKASMVTILAVNPRGGIQGHGDVPAADIALHLARHGVRAEAAHTVTEDIGDGDTLLSYAADIGADLIVAGGYGHSRAREIMFGGVTRSLLRAMTVPVLLSH